MNSRSAASVSLDDALRGEAFSYDLPPLIDRERVQKLFQSASPRFALGGFWCIFAEKTEQLAIDAHAELRDAIVGFRNAGGQNIILYCTNERVISAFKTAVRFAYGVEMRTVGSRDAVKQTLRELTTRKRV